MEGFTVRCLLFRHCRFFGIHLKSHLPKQKKTSAPFSVDAFKVRFIKDAPSFV